MCEPTMDAEQDGRVGAGSGKKDAWCDVMFRNGEIILHCCDPIDLESRGSTFSIKLDLVTADVWFCVFDMTQTSL